MLENPNEIIMNEGALSDEQLEQVTGGKRYKKIENEKGEKIRVRNRAGARMEEEADVDARGYAEADARFF